MTAFGANESEARKAVRIFVTFQTTIIMTLRKAVKLAKKELDTDETCIIRKGKREIWCFSRPMADTLKRLVDGKWKKKEKIYIVTAS